MESVQLLFVQCKQFIRPELYFKSMSISFIGMNGSRFRAEFIGFQKEV
jgi:hypothetical protein